MIPDMMIDYQFSLYSGFVLLAAFLSLVLAILAWRRREERSAYYLALIEFSLFAWATPITLETAATSVEGKLLWSIIAYPGTIASSIFVFLFAITLSKKDAWITKQRLIGLVVPGIFVFLCALTNSWHGLVWKQIVINPETNIAVYHHGPVFYVLILYAYMLLSISVVTIFKARRQYPLHYNPKIWLITLSTAIPFFSNLMYVFNLSPIPGVDWTLFGFVGSGALMSVGFLFYDLFVITPIAYNLLIDQLPDGVIVLDKHERIIDFNPTAQTLFNLKKANLGQLCTAAIPLLSKQINEQIHHPDKKLELTLETIPQKTLEIQFLTIQQHHKGIGKLFLFRDISAVKTVQNQLSQAKIELEFAVEERTQQLNNTISRLLEEISTRKRSEKELKQIHESLANRLSEQNQRLSTIYETILLSGNNQSEKTTLQQTLNNLRSGTRADGALLYRYQKASDTFHLTVLENIPVPEKVEVLPAGWVTNNDVTQVIHSLPGSNKLPEILKFPQFVSAVFAPIHLQGKIVGLLGLYWQEQYQPSVEEIAMINALADQTGIIQENIRLREQIETKATQEERRRLARELHDLVTQSIHSLVLSSDTARSRLQKKNYTSLETSLELINESARQALKDMRLLLYELRLVRLEEVNLSEALRTRIESVEKRAGIEAVLQIDESLVWPFGWQGEIYAIIMEAMNNSLKYARASKIEVSILEVENSFLVTIKDDGVGFDQDITTGHQGGIGFHSMKERAEKLGGTILIQSNLGEGTLVSLAIPIPELQEVG